MVSSSAALNPPEHPVNASVAAAPAARARAARGIASLGEESAVHGVHCGEVIHIRKENRSLDDAVHSAAGSLKDTADIGKGLSGLRLYPLGELPGLGIKRELTRNKKHIPNAHSLRIRAYRAGSLIGTYRSFH